MSDTGLCRIAVIATPRSGNTWVRRLLATLGELEELAVHTPQEVAWDALPGRCILQLHWPNTAPFTEILDEMGFRAVTIARHPIDVLISALHFAQHEPQTARWLDGAGGNEQSIVGASPRSRAFLDYATGPRSQALLTVSHQWWGVPACRRVRYEELVDDPAGQLNRVAAEVGILRRISPGEAIAANTLEWLRSTSTNQHFWQGQPGLWRRLIPSVCARRIEEVHWQVFRDLGYPCDPDDRLDDRRADANWLAASTA